MALATEKQKLMTKQLCEQLNKKIPENLDSWSSSEVYEMNTRLMQERYADKKKEIKTPQTVTQAVEEELKINPAKMGMCIKLACDEIRTQVDEKGIPLRPSEHPVVLVELARKYYSIATELEKV